eukprot:gene21572-28567_t
MLDAASAVITACSGPMAEGGKLHEYDYGGVTVNIKEGALGDGLGAKVWRVSHNLCRELVDYPEGVRGQRVLEIGAGCGVVITDVEVPVMLNLRDCMFLNKSGKALAPSLATAPATASDSELFDNAEEVDDFDISDLLGEGVGEDGQKAEEQAGGAAATGESAPWDCDNMRVRVLDWQDALNALDGTTSGHAPETSAGSIDTSNVRVLVWQDALNALDGTASGPAPEASARSIDIPKFLPTFQICNVLCQMQVRVLDWQDALNALDGTASGPAPEASAGSVDIPKVATTDKFPVVLGNEVMYEPFHAVLVAATLANHLEKTFDTFATECKKRGLRLRKRRLQPTDKFGGVLGQEHEYEGGFLLMAIDFESLPCKHWHRDDFEAWAV